MTTALAPVPEEFSIDRLVAQKAGIQRAFGAVMKEKEHYGIIPGCDKPSLWQPGADTLCFMFRLRADYEVVESHVTDEFIAYTVRCRLFHIDTGREWGSGIGACNTREKRYTSQTTEKRCPKCNKGAIIKGSENYGGGWVCWKKKGGCGEKFADDDGLILNIDAQISTNGVWDLQNTVLKMAQKRSRVAAVLTATAASDIFTQDLEDLVEYMPPPAAEERRGPQGVQPQAQPVQQAQPPAQAKHSERRAPSPDKCTCFHAPEQHSAKGCDVMGCECQCPPKDPRATGQPATQPAPVAPSSSASAAASPKSGSPQTTGSPSGNGDRPNIYPLATPAEVKKLNIAITESLGIRDRDEKLKWIGGMLGYRVGTSKDIPSNKIGSLIFAAQNGEVPADWAGIVGGLIDLPEAPGAGKPMPGWNG